MQQKKIGDILYVFQVEPYEITEDTSAEIIKVQEECVVGFKTLNASLADKIVAYNYHAMVAQVPVWAPYVDDPEPQKQSPELSWSAESITVTIGADNNVFPTLTNPHGVTVTYSSTDSSVATVDENGNVTLTGPNVTFISAAFAGDDTYAAQTVTYQITVEAAQVQTHYFVVNAINGENPLDGDCIYDTTAGDWTKNLDYYSASFVPDHYDVMLAIGHDYKIYNATIASMTSNDVTIGSQVDDHYDFTMPNDVVNCTVQAPQENNEEQPE